MTAEAPDAYAPQPGDLICFGRGNAAALRYEHLPAGPFTAHCDIVVTLRAGWLEAVGGNFDNAVTMKRVKLMADGRLASGDGLLLDARYPWLVVLRLTVPPM